MKYRLPRLWQRVLDGEVEVWRALRMAEFTMSLPLDAAAFVDQAVAPFVHSLSWAQLERTVEAARATTRIPNPGGPTSTANRAR